MNNPTAIRCIENRPHGVYDKCGRLLAAIEDGHIFFYCEMCKEFFELVDVFNDNVELKRVPKDRRIKLTTKLSRMED